MERLMQHCVPSLELHDEISPRYQSLPGFSIRLDNRFLSFLSLYRTKTSWKPQCSADSQGPKNPEGLFVYLGKYNEGCFRGREKLIIEALHACAKQLVSFWLFTSNFSVCFSGYIIKVHARFQVKGLNQKETKIRLLIWS